MNENDLAQPSPIRHPMNPHLPTHRGDETELVLFGLDLRVEWSGYTLEHVWAGDADIDILPLLTGAQEEALWEKINEN